MTYVLLSYLISESDKNFLIHSDIISKPNIKENYRAIPKLVTDRMW